MLCGSLTMMRVPDDTAWRWRGGGCRVSLRPTAGPGHTASMAVTYGVIGASRDEVAAALAQLCELLGLEPLTTVQMPGQDRWIARAEAPEPESRAG